MRTTCLLAGFTLTSMLFAANSSGADPRLMNLVMPDAASLAGINVANAKNTPFGQYVITQVTSAVADQLQSFVSSTGFDPRQDVSEVLAASASGPASSGLVLALGNFQVSQLTAAAAAKSPQMTVTSYGGATLISGTGTIGTGAAVTKTSFSVAFMGTNVAILGDTGSVKAAIDRSSAVNSINPALATQVQSLSSTQDAWMVTTSPFATILASLTSSSATPAGATPATAAGPLGQMGQMFNGILGSSGGVKFGTVVQVTGQAMTKDAPTAKSLADVLTALVSIAAMSGGQMPGGAAGGGQNAQFAAIAQLLQNVKVTANGATINLAMSVPETQLENALKAMQAPAPIAKPAAPAAPKPAVVRPAITQGE